MEWQCLARVQLNRCVTWSQSLEESVAYLRFLVLSCTNTRHEKHGIVRGLLNINRREMQAPARYNNFFWISVEMQKCSQHCIRWLHKNVRKKGKECVCAYVCVWVNEREKRDPKKGLHSFIEWMKRAQLKCILFFFQYSNNKCSFCLCRIYHHGITAHDKHSQTAHLVVTHCDGQVEMVACKRPLCSWKPQLFTHTWKHGPYAGSHYAYRLLTARIQPVINSAVLGEQKAS